MNSGVDTRHGLSTPRWWRSAAGEAEIVGRTRT
jgi:hypothetical protein